MPLTRRFGTLRYLTRYHETRKWSFALPVAEGVTMRYERKVNLVQVAEEYRRSTLLIQVSLKESVA